jgi:hypothetical protein
LSLSFLSCTLDSQSVGKNQLDMIAAAIYDVFASTIEAYIEVGTQLGLPQGEAVSSTRESYRRRIEHNIQAIQRWRYRGSGSPAQGPGACSEEQHTKKQQ